MYLTTIRMPNVVRTAVNATVHALILCYAFAAMGFFALFGNKDEDSGEDLL